MPESCDIPHPHKVGSREPCVNFEGPDWRLVLNGNNVDVNLSAIRT